MTKKQVVSAYVEDISVKLFDHHPSDLYEILGKEGGIYALYKKNGSLYYVGLAKNLYARIRTHRRDKHKRKWSRFSAYITTHSEQIRELEAIALRISFPKGNSQKGKLKGAKNLITPLKQFINETNRLHEADMLGGMLAKKRRKRMAKGTQGSAALLVLSGRRRKLKATRGDQTYNAVLLLSGKIKFDGEQYDSPSAAAKAATGIRRNGWRFWSYYAGNREWKQLRTLK